MMLNDELSWDPVTGEATRIVKISDDGNSMDVERSFLSAEEAREIAAQYRGDREMDKVIG